MLLVELKTSPTTVNKAAHECVRLLGAIVCHSVHLGGGAEEVAVIREGLKIQQYLVSPSLNPAESPTFTVTFTAWSCDHSTFTYIQREGTSTLCHPVTELGQSRGTITL